MCDVIESATVQPATAQTPAAPSACRCLVIVPAYNEAGAIAGVVRQLHETLPHCDVLVVDDGSTDGTADHVPATATLVRLPFNQGIGGAMQTGYRYAHLHGYDVAVQVDGDGQHPASAAGKLIEHMRTSDADMIVGSRFLALENGEASYRPSTERMVGIKMLRGLLRLLTGKRFTDCTSGLRVVNRRVIGAFAHWYPEDYPEPEVILLLHRGGFVVREAAITMEARMAGQTSIPFRAGMFYVLKVGSALLLDMMREPWPMQIRGLSNGKEGSR